MPAVARFTLAVLLVTAPGLPDVVGATPDDTLRSRPTRSAAAVLGTIEAAIGRMVVSERPVAADVAQLTDALVLARGRDLPTPALATMATHLAGAVAQGNFDGDDVERLAQNLYAAVHGPRDLSSHEGGLLVVDITTVLISGGAQPASIDAVASALAGICPAVVSAPAEPAAPRARTLQVLTRR